jgi:hypothetical protein
MKIFEVIADYLISTNLFEMSIVKKEAERNVAALSPVIFDNLIKLFVFDLPECRNGWIKELNAWLRFIDSIHLKQNNKKPEATVIYNWLVFNSAPNYTPEYVERRIQIMIEDEFEHARVYDYDAELVLNQIFKILDQVCKDIAKEERGVSKFTNIRNYLP